MVEHGFQVVPGASLQVGDAIGFVEGFKAVSELHSAVNGRFLSANPALREKPDLINQDPYDAGWLYAAEGTPDPACLDVQGYRDFLDRTIDRMRVEEAGEETR
jgi:glycine cleavage system H protein